MQKMYQMTAEGTDGLKGWIKESAQGCDKKKKKNHSDKVKRERVKGDENSGGWKNHKLARVCQSGEFL